LRAGFRIRAIFLAKLRNPVNGRIYLFSQFCYIMLALWTIRCYVSPNGRDLIDDWNSRQSDEVQAAVAVALEYLVQRPRKEWRRPEFDLLSGNLREIGEIRLRVDKQYRILGFFGPGRSDFTLLVGASKKGRNYDPHNALDTALDRMRRVTSNGRQSRVCDF
jgi:hypothetical protein